MKKEINCSLIKGVNYTPSYARNDIEEWRDYDEATVECELEYAKRIGFNCIRPFLSYAVYADNKKKFLNHLLHMVRTADSLGLKVMPVVFDSCFSEREPTVDVDLNEWIPNPGVMNLGKDFWEKGEAYCLDLIHLLQNESGLLMWDVMNEPLCTQYISKYSPQTGEKHKQEIYAFLKHFCDFFRKKDEINPITVGHAGVDSNKETNEWVDIISYHDYSATDSGMEGALLNAVEIGRKCGKQVFCSETGCPGRANPYDAAIKILNQHGIGYFVWELMIGRSFWNNRHGVVYPDGTVRDASIVAAVNGFFRRRENRVAYQSDIEGNASLAVKRAKDWLNGDEKNLSEGLEIVNHLANLLESNQLVPECDLPTAAYEAMKKRQGLTADDIAEQLLRWLPIPEKDIARQH